MFYNFRYLRRYWPRQLAVVLVVAAATVTFVLLTAAMDSFEAITQLSSERDNVMVVARGGVGEQWPELSHIAASGVSHLKSIPGVARAPDGTPLVSPELLYAADVTHGGRRGQVSVRGVVPEAFGVHRIVTADPDAERAIAAGGVVVGSRVGDLLGTLRVGDEITFLGRSWRVSGFFRPARSQTQFDSEIWVPIADLMKARRTESYGIATVKADNGAALAGIVDAINTNEDVMKDLRAVPEVRVSSVMTGALSAFRAVHTVFTILLMGVAGVGVLNAMLNNVMRRRRDMALLRALGASSGAVAFGFIVEGVILAVAGAALGSGLSFLGHNAPITVGTLSRGAPMVVQLQFGASAVATALLIGAVFGAACAVIPAFVSTRFTVRAELGGE